MEQSKTNVFIGAHHHETELRAEVRTEAIAGLLNNQLTTKHNHNKLEINLKREFRELELRLILRPVSKMVTRIAVAAKLIKIYFSRRSCPRFCTRMRKHDAPVRCKLVHYTAALVP